MSVTPSARRAASASWAGKRLIVANVSRYWRGMKPLYPLMRGRQCAVEWSMAGASRNGRSGGASGNSATIAFAWDAGIPERETHARARIAEGRARADGNRGQRERGKSRE